jgi:trigger factor
MSTKIEKIQKNIIKLEIEVPAQKFEEAVQKSFKKNQTKFAIPGFRKGKAPRNIIERYYGESAFYEDAVEFAYPKAYEELIKKEDLEPVDYPKLDIVQIGKNKDFIFTATVTVKPDVEISEYKNIEINKVNTEVSEEDINNKIKEEQDRNARVIKVEDRTAKNGDICVIDFEGFIDGVPFEGGKGTDYSLTLGSNSFIPGFETQLEEKPIGEEIDVNVSFPEEYHKAELAGKPALFKVKINEIKEKILPELDDDFAKDISEFDTFIDYKNSVREKLQKALDENSKVEMENQLLDKLIQNAVIDLPDVMIENKIDQYIKEMDRNMRHKGFDLKKYLEITGGDYQSFRENFKERAEKEVKVSLIVEKIGKIENIQVTDEQLDNNIKELAQSSGDTYENFLKYINEEVRESLKETMVHQKTLEFLIDNTRVI